MRKIERQMMQAIADRKNFRCDNTTVRIAEEGTLASIYLHGNHIASVDLYAGSVFVNKTTLARWPTPTTKSRLRALRVNVTTRKGITYLNDEAV